MTVLTMRRIEFAGCVVAIEAPVGELSDGVEFLFAHVPVPDKAASPAAVYRLVQIDETPRYGLYRGIDLIYLSHHVDEILSGLLNRVCHTLAEMARGGSIFHAGAVGRNGLGVLLPGEPGAGKSTFTAWLVQQGYTYLTDELVFVAQGTVQLETLPRALQLRTGSRFIWEDKLAQNQAKPSVLRGAESDLVSPEVLGAAGAGSRADLALIVFPRFAPDEAFRLTALSKAQTGMRLVRHLFNGSTLGRDGFVEIARIARQARAFAVSYGNFAQVDAEIDSVLSCLTV